jgi:hypothetical protein
VRGATRPRLTGHYLTGNTLYALAVNFSGYYWERENGTVFPDDDSYTYRVFLGNGAYIGGAQSPAECRAIILAHFKTNILELR